jgi:class 3 adenylate cyclase/predicted ATPase
VKLGPSEDLGEWLRSLGLEKYGPAFRANAIDETVLPDLTEDHLREIGIPLGARIKLLKAIAALNERTETIAPTSVGRATRPVEAAERRQLTVMFSDLVGSTAMAASMDPEDLREVISAYQKCAAETVRRFDGCISRYMGDGVLVYFGYPKAHEDDAERAVRAGLELISALAGLKIRASLQTRIGIATGLVVVGDLIGSGEAQERGAVGETPNLAARLQGIAEPDTIVIAENTRRLLGNLFDLTDLGPKELKGVAEPVRVWTVLRPSSIESRFEALHAGHLSALVGRKDEMDLLLRCWSKAKTGEGQVVLLSGEAGIGKSRLTAALLGRLAGESHTRLRYFCSSQRTDSAFYPIINQMEHVAGLAHDDTPTAKLDKLDSLLARTSTLKQDAVLFAELLSIPNDGRYPAPDLPPMQRRQKTVQALIAQVEVLTLSSPILIIFEDAHWSDPSSLEVLDQIIDWIVTFPVLLIATFRPDFAPTWTRRPHVTALTINRLGQRESDAMIDLVIGDKLLPVDIRQDIIERTDGIPLFVEEMTKAVLEAREESEAQRIAAAMPAARSVPATLHASLMARLDRLGPAKEVAQVGSAIGRKFSHVLLASVMHPREAELEAALDLLIAAGLLFRQGVPPHASYLFKHTLVQDVAYGTMLREPRRTLHARIAESLESNFPDIAESQPELLARHFTEAGLIEKAVGLWSKAGKRSLECSALLEATEHLTRALNQIAVLPSTQALRREQINLQVALITPLIHVKGYAAPEVKAATDRARLLIEQAEALGEPPEDPLLLFSVLYGAWVANYVGCNGVATRDLAEQFLTLAEKQRATVPLMVGHRIMGISLATSGGIAPSQAHFNQALRLYNTAEHRPLATRFGHDSRVAVLVYRSASLWCLGYPEAALKDAQHALDDAREIDQAATTMYALRLVLLTYVQCGNYDESNALLDQLLALAHEKGASFWKASGILTRGCILALTGKASEAVQSITSGLTALRSTGGLVGAPLYLAYLTKAYSELGQFNDAWRCISEAMTAVETTKECCYEAEVYRIAGELALLSPEPDVTKAEAHFERALAVARYQQAKSLELRVAMSMARLRRDQGKGHEARDLLAGVYGWFTEGFNTLDLREAKALLDTLGS